MLLSTRLWSLIDVTPYSETIDPLTFSVASRLFQ